MGYWSLNGHAALANWHQLLIRVNRYKVVIESDANNFLSYLLQNWMAEIVFKCTLLIRSQNVMTAAFADHHREQRDRHPSTKFWVSWCKQNGCKRWLRLTRWLFWLGNSQTIFCFAPSIQFQSLLVLAPCWWNLSGLLRDREDIAKIWVSAGL